MLRRKNDCLRINWTPQILDLTADQERLLKMIPVNERRVSHESDAWNIMMLEQLGLIVLTDVLSVKNAKYVLSDEGKKAIRDNG